MNRYVLALICTPLLAAPVAAQTVEAVGSRALGMGGAFVAVANDSSATWWNPAALAAGPFVDFAIARTVSAVDDGLPAGELPVTGVSLATLPFGVSYYRLRITDIRSADPTAQDRADRQDRRAGVSVRSASVSQFGATILHTVAEGIHVGTTLKYVRGVGRAAVVPGAEAVETSIGDLIELGSELEGGDSEGTFDLDVGALVVAGAIRVGALVRNVREPEVGGHTLPRQVRIGAAFDADAIDALPFMLSLDADVRRYDTVYGERRVVAVGAEHWIRPRRFAVRAGARLNTVGARGEAVSAGASISLRAGTFIDGHVVVGTEAGEDGWGLAARVSF